MVIAAPVAKLRTVPIDGTLALIVAEPDAAILPDQPVMTLEPAEVRSPASNMGEDRLGKICGSALLCGCSPWMAAPPGSRG